MRVPQPAFRLPCAELPVWHDPDFSVQLMGVLIAKFAELCARAIEAGTLDESDSDPVASDPGL